MFCPNCGKPIDDNAVFCPECGAKVGLAPAAPAYGAPASPAKKGLSKGALIGIIAGAVVTVAAVVLILVLGGNKLVGTWKADLGSGYDYSISFEIKFKRNGEFELRRSYGGSTDSEHGTYTVDSHKNLTLNFDGSPEVFEYNKEEAMDGDDDCWYLDGRTLYLGGLKFKKG